MSLPDEWLRGKHWIEASSKITPFPEPIEEYERKIETGEYQFWPGENSATITEIAFFQGRKAMIVRCCGGDLTDLDCVETALCAIAKDMGCEVIMSEGRKGWEKFAKGHGYKFAWITMIKELANAE